MVAHAEGTPDSHGADAYAGVVGNRALGQLPDGGAVPEEAGDKDSEQLTVVSEQRKTKGERDDRSTNQNNAGRRD